MGVALIVLCPGISIKLLLLSIILTEEYHL